MLAGWASGKECLIEEGGKLLCRWELPESDSSAPLSLTSKLGRPGFLTVKQSEGEDYSASRGVGEEGADGPRGGLVLFISRWLVLSTASCVKERIQNRGRWTPEFTRGMCLAWAQCSGTVWCLLFCHLLSLSLGMEGLSEKFCLFVPALWGLGQVASPGWEVWLFKLGLHQPLLGGGKDAEVTPLAALAPGQ